MVLIKKIFLISFFLILISCESNKPYILVEPGKVEVNKIYSVITNKKWSQFQQEEYNFLFWTVDGYTLDRILFFKPLEEGKSLFDHDSYFTKESEKRPIFNSKMNKFNKREDLIMMCLIDIKTGILFLSDHFRIHFIMFMN